MVIHFIFYLAVPALQETGIESQPSAVEKFSEEFFSISERMVDENYRIIPDDSILVVVKGNPHYSFISRVTKDGKLPLFVPSLIPQMGMGGIQSNVSTTLELLDFLNAEGLKIGELKNKIKDKIKKYIKVKEVNVSLWSSGKFKVMVTGSVESPGVYLASPFLRLYDAIEMAGGVSSIGDIKETRLIRDGDTLLCDISKFILSSDTTVNPFLKPGDIIYIPLKRGYFIRNGEILCDRIPESEHEKIPRSVINFHGKTFPIEGITLMGEVKNPGIVPWVPGYKALDYITLAGGFTEIADATRIVVKRRDGRVVDPEVELIPGDMVYVNPKMWTHVSNFIQITSVILSIVSIMYTIR